jgi:hypothetical protein
MGMFCLQDRDRLADLIQGYLMCLDMKCQENFWSRTLKNPRSVKGNWRGDLNLRSSLINRELKRINLLPKVIGA